ncbi:metalloproteinase inhibitor 3-like [Carcharodon carcharias]|uniref:metalloproteinase inhibitor 3-like n=1 Tax=Carcharodon carcharias TaxID=13397 RepID=UPI001B7F18D3|nr:metalloproteinase inhibitor 3-like [Carcharodon carcharias]
MSCYTLRFMALGLLLLAMLEQTEACSCGPSHPQQAYCQADVVIKGKIVGSKMITRDNSDDSHGFPWIEYEVQQQKMYKGFEKIQQVEYVYTPLADFVCGMVLGPDEMNQDYILSGTVEADGKVYINICSFNRPWSQLTHAQQTSLDGRYKDGCRCKIVPCLSLPCSLDADNQCLWTDGIFTGNWSGAQSQRFTCVMKPKGLCQWVSAPSSRAHSSPLRREAH